MNGDDDTLASELDSAVEPVPAVEQHAHELLPEPVGHEKEDEAEASHDEPAIPPTPAGDTSLKDSHLDPHALPAPAGLLIPLDTRICKASGLQHVLDVFVPGLDRCTGKIMLSEGRHDEAGVKALGAWWRYIHI